MNASGSVRWADGRTPSQNRSAPMSKRSESARRLAPTLVLVFHLLAVISVLAGCISIVIGRAESALCFYAALGCEMVAQGIDLTSVLSRFLPPTRDRDDGVMS